MRRTARTTETTAQRQTLARPPAEGPFYRPIGLLRGRGRELSAARRAFPIGRGPLGMKDSGYVVSPE